MTGWTTRLTWLAFALAAAAAVYLLVAPVYSGFEGDRPTHATLLEVNGTWVVIPVLFPVVLALVPLRIPRQGVRIVVTILMGLFAFIGGFTIGMFYLPAAAAMLMAACVGTSANRRDTEANRF
jgi:hypothetical protein